MTKRGRANVVENFCRGFTCLSLILVSSARKCHTGKLQPRENEMTFQSDLNLSGSEREPVHRQSSKGSTSKPSKKPVTVPEPDSGSESEPVLRSSKASTSKVRVYFAPY